MAVMAMCNTAISAPHRRSARNYELFRSAAWINVRAQSGNVSWAGGWVRDPEIHSNMDTG